MAPIKKWLLLWLLLSYIVCLAPGPCFWTDLFAQSEPPVAAVKPAPAATPAVTPVVATKPVPLPAVKPSVKPSPAPAVKRAVKPAVQPVIAEPKVASERKPAPARLSRIIDSIFTQDRGAKEMLVHFALMCGVAFCFSRSFFAESRMVVSIIGSLAFVLLIAFSIEGLQELVPDYFHRGFAWSDIGFSLAGGTLGALAATLVSRLRVFTTRCR